MLVVNEIDDDVVDDHREKNYFDDHDDVYVIDIDLNHRRDDDVDVDLMNVIENDNHEMI
jgi:hypothetical protein